MWRRAGDNNRQTPLLEALCYRSVTKSCLTPCNPWTAAICAPLSHTTSWSLPRFMSIELVILSNHLILCHSLCLLPSVFPSTRVFFSQWVSSWHQVAKVLGLQLQHQSFNEYSGWISFRIDWFDLLAGQGTLKNFHIAYLFFSSPWPLFYSLEQQRVNWMILFIRAFHRFDNSANTTPKSWVFQREHSLFLHFVFIWNGFQDLHHHRFLCWICFKF